MSDSEIYITMIFSILCIITLLISIYSIGHYFGAKGYKNIFNIPLASKKAFNIIIILIVVFIIITFIS